MGGFSVLWAQRIHVTNFTIYYYGYDQRQLALTKFNKRWGLQSREVTGHAPRHRSFWKPAGGRIENTAEVKTNGPCSAGTSFGFFSFPETSDPWVVGQ